MNCDECRDLMLEADHAVLAGHGEGPLAAHLRGCISCRLIAASIVADTRVLASVVERRRTLWRRPVAVAGLAAAGLVLAIGVRERRHAPSQTAAAAVERVSRGGVAPVVRPTDTSSRLAAAPREPSASAAAAAPVRAPRAPRRPIRTVAYQPTAFVATPIRVTAEASDRAPMVSVRPPFGRRAAVFHTASSGVTIVWLY